MLYNIFENLNVSKECFKEIMETIEKHIQTQTKAAESSLPSRQKKVHDLMNSIQFAKSREERKNIIKNLGRAQKRVQDAESKTVKEEPENSGIRFSANSWEK